MVGGRGGAEQASGALDSAWRECSQAKMRLHDDGAGRLDVEGIPNGENCLGRGCLYSAASAHLPFLPMNNTKTAKHGSGGLAIGGKLAIYKLALALRCVWFGLSSVLKAI
jgi:hypothetical protein